MVRAVDRSSSRTLRQLKLIGRIAGISSELGHRQVPTAPLYSESDALGSDTATIDADLSEFKSRGWVDYFASIAGIREVVLKQPGVDAGSDFEEFRSSARNRVPEARNAVLQWLYDEHLGGNDHPRINDFLVSPHADFLGIPYAQSDVIRASTWLSAEGYVAGTAVSGGMIPRPRITIKGINVAESGLAVNQVKAQGGTTVNNNVNIEGSHAVNVAVGSSDVNQSNTVTDEQIKQTTEFVGSTRDLLPVLGLTGEQQDIVGEIVDELEAEATSTAPNQSKMKELTGKVVEIVVTGTATGMVNALVAMGNGAILGLG